MHHWNGEQHEGRGAPFTLTNPATAATTGTYRLATADDVDEAVAAAKAAYPAFKALTPGERADLLLGLADELEARSEEIAALESAQTGKTIRLATEFDVPGSIDNARFFAGAARQLTGLSAGTYWEKSTSMIRREPLGVVGSIAPWNYPLQMAAWKILPAVAAGNTIVLKTSEMTPGTSLILAEAATAAGFPPGVINVIAGDGRDAGEALVTHPDVVMTSFTGSTPVGRRIMDLAARKGARVHLELGGKAPLVVFADADIEAAARGAVAGSLINSGQDCTAATRAIVAAEHFEAFTDRVAELMAGVRLGDPAEPATDMGSLISLTHRDRVAAMVERAREAGATIRTGGQIPTRDHLGGDLPGDPESTAYYAPTLITGIDTDAEVWRDEIFGPVLVAVPFDTDDEAIALANDTPYGLAASAWTRSTNRALRAAADIEAGCVWINEHIPIVSDMPHGGYKASGFGKDMSQYSFDEYTQIKHVFIDQHEDPHHAWQDTIFTT
ncbi:aminobutyraldehyde dehydrogenase [Brevibacterium casei]|uniref:Betaine-aldehyde dehydrogenase n=1 Tax=Brevibacterium casei CIP 102111 TaxID=1255625 RepID=A0A2H1J4W9_9MICO|nr:aminobutyraldehyde dehydrogenase [Brevibacterium casei]MCT1549603.1 aminobutyraldehyde dehydrogenase [Brevibacterium casei]MCT1561093.1 aminobutyraldehyde dehydrogenase [Brevibacterium casei]MCT2208876.1 aminobutyraldehyde dehydrogenase [Brevibacterium casei]QPR39319.1 aminobutyraldehyde dehydrogenase [Brevibacterium casei]QPR43484.1 aminobutyraldehyde dehydrogenase [Brevibacterium casei]